jgi:hypothetical protein
LPLGDRQAAKVIRIELRKHLRMSDEPTPLQIRKRRLVDYRNRGAIYSWLRAHHARVKSLLDTGEATWPRLCAEMVRHGVLDRAGAAPTPNPAIKVWRRLCDELGDSPPVYRFKNYPSRVSKDWRPEVVSRPSAERPRGQLTPGIHPPGTSLIRKPEQENAVTGRKLTGEEKLARLEAELASRRSG